MTPVVFTWAGDAMIPVPAAARLCDRQFTIGEQYRMEPREDRSKPSHDHFFARVTELFENLPERLDGKWATDDHLRKWALIKAGFRDERSFVASSKAEAVRLAAFVKQFDDYAIVTVSGNVVTSYAAKSQSLKAMGKATFQASKEAVLGILDELVGIVPASPREAVSV